MGKSKPKRARPNTVPSLAKQSKTKHQQHGAAQKFAAANPSSSQAKPKPKPTTQAQHLLPMIPFTAEDRMLLIGEADLSFARSLVEHHSCIDITATVLEKDIQELECKYPYVRENVTVVEEAGANVVFGVDATKMAAWTEGRDKVGRMDRVVFNFPHVGGKSTDVNRQVRYNQELLVSFFKRAVLSLAPGGSIIVTLFEGEPYTLWNIRDLARHCGLQVERSFKFQASAYPGYHHARTFGVVKSKSGNEGAGWRGEDRPARSYVFIHKGEEVQENLSKSKRKRGHSSSEDDEDD